MQANEPYIIIIYKQSCMHEKKVFYLIFSTIAEYALSFFFFLSKWKSYFAFLILTSFT